MTNMTKKISTGEKISIALTGRSLSEKHKSSISRSLKGKAASEETRNRLHSHVLNHHHNRYEWILIDPQNKMIRTKHLRKLCVELNLCYSSFRYKAQQGNSLPIKRGLSAGWTVFATRKLKL